MPGSFENGVTSPSYEVRSPQGASGYYPPTTSGASRYPPPQTAPYPQDEKEWSMNNYYADLPPHERPGYVPPQTRYPAQPHLEDEDLAYGESALSSSHSRQPSYGPPYQTQTNYPRQLSEDHGSGYRYPPQGVTKDPRTRSYTYQYAQPPDKITYTDRPHIASRSTSYTQSAQTRPVEQLPRNYSDARHGSYSQEANYYDITPGADRGEQAASSSKPHRLSASTQQQHPGLHAPRSPGLGPRMNRLSVSGDRPDLHSIGGNAGMPPPSPLLEAYRGTYQSLSPMPLALRPDDSDLSDIEPLSASVSRNSHGEKARGKIEKDAERIKEKKRVVVYDPEADAKKMARALSHSKVDSDPIIDILPALSHDQIWELRKEYKKQVKIQGKGINLPKHLKMKLTGNFGKAAYVTALGRWESEGYWANFWYQSHGSRRELLIESLMGRTNAEIRNIKDEFKDKRYSDSLTKCMEKELKMDKFRTAVLMVLEEKRQEEQDAYPIEYRNRDVEMLHRSLTAERGGESAMLDIIVRRSDAHLREVLKTYERMYDENFARAALRKSNNLVGEVVAHILNGVINKPTRDAMLLHHAIQDIAEKNKDDELRYELLISRLVRLHWDKMHLMRVKRAYADKYKRELQKDIEEATKGDFREFMCELCEVK